MTNFEGLSSYDFEILIQDLLGAEWGIHLESFAPGRDEGIDVRHLGPKLGAAPAILVQCKHYERSGYSSLKTALKKDASKVAPKTARRYVLATTVSMTPKRKRELVAELPTLLKSETDILGREDIEALIRKHPSVERAHFKLWLNSTAVLDLVIHNDILARTEDYVETLKARAAIFVENDSVNEAREMLESEHVCIISGPPGVGKSTLADILLMVYLADGYEPYLISEDIGEADAMYRKDVKQVFLYDDFLGRTTSLEKLGKNEDQRLINFMRRVSRAGTKRFILTTRQYILEQAKLDYERLDSSEVEVARYFLDVGTYTRQHRGHILYNHLYFSELSNDHLAAFTASRAYRQLTDSSNFNPRIVETAIRLAIREAVEPSDLGPFLARALANPVELWRHVMRNQLSLEQRTVLAIMAAEGRAIDLDRLEGMYVTLAASNASVFSQPFSTCLSGLEGLTISLTGAKATFAQFENPGVEDAVIRHILPQTPVLRLVSQVVDSYQQIIGLWNHANETERSVLVRRTTPTASRALASRPRDENRLRPELQRALDATLTDFILRAVHIRDRRSWLGPNEEEMFLAVAELTRSLPEPLEDSDLADFMREIGENYRAGEGAKEHAFRIARAMATSSNLPKDHAADVLDAAVEFMISSSSDSQSDFNAMLDLYLAVENGEIAEFKKFEGKCPGPEDLLTEIDEFLPTYLDDLAGTEDLTGVRSGLEDWESLLAEFDRNLDYYSPDLWGEVERAEAEEGYEPEYDKDDRFASGGSTDDLDDLFDSLADR